MVEHATVNRVVVGSSPTSGATRALSDSPLQSARGTAAETPLQSQTVCKSGCRFRAEPQFARTPPRLPHYSVTGRKSELLSSSDGDNAEKIPTLPTRGRRLLLAGKRHRKPRKPQNKEPHRGGGTHAGEERGAAAASPQSRTWPRLPLRARPTNDRADVAARDGRNGEPRRGINAPAMPPWDAMQRVCTAPE